VDTWTRSWFGNEGLRVLYVAPRGWTDGWLPTSVTPAPTAFTRTLVGRIEALTPEDEAALVQQIEASAASGAVIDPATLGRFAEARVARSLEQLTDAQSIAYAQDLLARAHAMP
jgi:hypothetical protein